MQTLAQLSPPYRRYSRKVRLLRPSLLTLSSRSLDTAHRAGTQCFGEHRGTLKCQSNNNQPNKTTISTMTSPQLNLCTQYLSMDCFERGRLRIENFCRKHLDVQESPNMLATNAQVQLQVYKLPTS